MTWNKTAVAVVAAHPDDEVLGVGVLLKNLKCACAIIHVTDGAPRSGEDFRDAGCATWREYAALRRREFEDALAAAGLTDAVTFRLDCPDQQAVVRIAENANRLATLFDRLRPSTVFTHAYEGGHPDHDATAAAVHLAARLVKAPFAIEEFAGYHAGADGMECECFIGGNQADVMPRVLTADEREWKREVLSCYASQAPVLAQFPLRTEPLRPAPRYDFSRPPHPGHLYYERFAWGVQPAEWRELAARACGDLRIPCAC